MIIVDPKSRVESILTATAATTTTFTEEVATRAFFSSWCHLVRFTACATVATAAATTSITNAIVGVTRTGRIVRIVRDPKKYLGRFIEEQRL